MYTVDDLDVVLERPDVPQSCTGAPCPAILAGEDYLHLAYYLDARCAAPGRLALPIVDESLAGERCALVRFTRAHAHMFGPPNDEAFAGHPLAARGLRRYAVSEVQRSSWIRRLERVNSVHPLHQPERFASYRHFVFAFHDTTFECVAQGFSLVVHQGTVSDVLRASWPPG